MSIRLDGRAPKFSKGDRVQSKSRRKGRVINVYGDTVLIKWDDGEMFQIREVHLTLIDHEEYGGK